MQYHKSYFRDPCVTVISRELSLTVSKHNFTILSTSLEEGVWDFPVKYQRKNGFELYIHIYEVNLRTFWGKRWHWVLSILLWTILIFFPIVHLLPPTPTAKSNTLPTPQSAASPCQDPFMQVHCLPCATFFEQCSHKYLYNLLWQPKQKTSCPSPCSSHGSKLDGLFILFKWLTLKKKLSFYYPYSSFII